MSNGINKRQNEENSIRLLGAQRQLYYEAKNLEGTIFLIGVAIPFILKVVQIFISQNSMLNTFTIIALITCTLVEMIKKSIIKKKKKMAAMIMQEFDTYVFKMPWNETLFGKKINIDTIVGEKAKKHFKISSKREKLIGWYVEEKDKLPHIKGIHSCQKENISWDMNLRKRYKWTSILFIILLLVIVIVINVINDNRVAQLLNDFFLVFPLGCWLYNTVINLNNDIERLEKLNVVLSEDILKTMDELQKIQKDIFEHRSNCLEIPDWLYEMFKKREEINAKEVTEIEVAKE